MPPLYLSVEVKQPRTIPTTTGNDEENEQHAYRRKKGRVLESVIWRPTGSDQPQNLKRQDTTTITSTSLSKTVNMESDQIMYDDKKKFKKKKESFAFPKQKINPRYEVNMNRYKAEYQFVREQLRSMEERIRAHEEHDDSLLEDGDTINIPDAVLEDYKIIDEFDQAPPVPPLPSIGIPSTKRSQSAQLRRPKSVVNIQHPPSTPRIRPQQKFDKGVHRDQVYENLHDVSTFGSMTRSVNISRPQLFYSKQKRASSAGPQGRPKTEESSNSAASRRIDTRSSFSGWRSALHDSLKSPLRQNHSLPSSTRNRRDIGSDFDFVRPPSSKSTTSSKRSLM